MGYIRFSKMQELVWKADTSTEYQEVNSTKYLTASNKDSNKEIELVISRIDFRYHKDFIIFGIRNLKLISEIYKRKTPFSTMIIIEITEADTQYFHIDGEESQLEYLKDSRVSLIIGNENQLGRQIDIALSDMLKLYNLRNIEILSMPYVKSMYPKEINSVLDMVFQKLYAFINIFGNDVEDILIGMDNYINNWSHIFRGLDCKYFENEYKGRPAIIVGAGPSLDKNVDFLSKAKGKALIFSVDGAMNTLKDKNITPNVVSSIERIELTANFYDQKDIPQDVVYVGPNVILGSILEKFERIIFTGRSGDAFFNQLNDSIGFTNLDVGINVSHVLLSFARYLGCYPIIFMGLDLAYTNGKTHTAKFSEYFDQDVMNNYKRNLVYVKGQNGETLETTENFMHTKSWIESFIARDKEGLYINATEGGAKIDGTVNSKLQDAISSYCNDEEFYSLRTIYDKVKKDQVIDATLTNKALDFFVNLNSYFNNIIKESQLYYDKLLCSKKMGRVELMEKQRSSMEDCLKENNAGRFILQSITISYHRDIHSFPMKLEKGDEKRMYERNLSYYKTIKAVSKKVIESIDAYKELLESYLNQNNVEIGG